MSPGADGIISLAMLGFFNSVIMPKDVNKFLTVVNIICMLSIVFFGQR
jgi:hypothetical protein